MKCAFTDDGGNTVTLTGRHLGFLDADVEVFVGTAAATGLLCTTPRVVVPYEEVTCVMPACRLCGEARVVVKTDDQVSNSLPYKYSSAWRVLGETWAAGWRGL